MQGPYHLIYREDEREMLRLCASEGIGVTPWSPLARGRLARAWQDEPQTDRAKNDPFAQRLYEKSKQLDKPVVDRVVEIAKARGVSPAQIALAWMLHKPVITSPIIGATKPGQLEDAIKAVSIKLSGEEIAKLEEFYEPHAQTEAFV